MILYSCPEFPWPKYYMFSLASQMGRWHLKLSLLYNMVMHWKYINRTNWHFYSTSCHVAIIAFQVFLALEAQRTHTQICGRHLGSSCCSSTGCGWGHSCLNYSWWISPLRTKLAGILQEAMNLCWFRSYVCIFPQYSIQWSYWYCKFWVTAECWAVFCSS
jgi:hypothetical protein